VASRRHASLKPHLNQVRNWVELGATDIWIAHQLGSTPASIAAFRQKNGLLRTGGAERPAPAAVSRPAPAGAAARAKAPEAEGTTAKRPRRRGGAKRAEQPATETPAVETPAPDAPTVDAPAKAPEGEAPGVEARAVEAPAAEAAAEPVGDPPEDATDATGDGSAERPRRRRGRRGGRGRGRSADADTPLELEGVFDHGEDGFGLWLDAAVRDAAVYRAHWSGHREVVVNVTPDEIVIRRVPGPDDDVDATGGDHEAATGGHG